MNKAVVQMLNEHLSPLKGEMPEGQRGFKGGFAAAHATCVVHAVYPCAVSTYSPKASTKFLKSSSFAIIIS